MTGSCATGHHDATPPETSSADEFVTIQDPAHPLYGRRLRLAAREVAPGRTRGTLLLFHERGVLLRVPSTAVDPPDSSRVVAKLNEVAIAELVEMAQEVLR